jgi:hypothetical protein
VFGTSCPPSGLSGALRDAAYRISEGRKERWVMLLAADRIDVVEGLIEDVAHLRLPNVVRETGWSSRLQHDRKGTAMTAVVALGCVAAAFMVAPLAVALPCDEPSAAAAGAAAAGARADGDGHDRRVSAPTGVRGHRPGPRTTASDRRSRMPPARRMSLRRDRDRRSGATSGIDTLAGPMVPWPGASGRARSAACGARVRRPPPRRAPPRSGAPVSRRRCP